MERALDASERIHAPHLLDIEVTQVLRRLVQRKEITIVRARQALDDFVQLLVERHEHQSLLPRVWQLRDSLSAYDGAYVALAEALGVVLATADARLSRVSGVHCQIEAVGGGR